MPEMLVMREESLQAFKNRMQGLYEHLQGDTGVRIGDAHGWVWTTIWTASTSIPGGHRIFPTPGTNGVDSDTSRALALAGPIRRPLIVEASGGGIILRQNANLAHHSRFAGHRLRTGGLPPALH